MKGRKPKPAEIRRREGNPGKRPIPETVVVDGRPQSLPVPEHLPEQAKEFWGRIVPTLAQVGILDGVDRPMLESAAIQYARAREAGDVVAREGLLTQTVNGQLVEHPAVKTERAAMKLLGQFAEQYALTPVARTRLGLAELQRRSLADELDTELGDRKVK